MKKNLMYVCSLSSLFLNSKVFGALNPSSEEQLADVESDMKGLKVAAVESPAARVPGPVPAPVRAPAYSAEAAEAARRLRNLDGGGLIWMGGQRKGLESVINSFYFIGGDQNYPGLKNCVMSPYYNDDVIFEVFMNLHNRFGARALIPEVSLVIAANALAVGRLALYARVRDLVKSNKFNLTREGKKLSQDAFILLELSCMPHLTARAIASEEFKGLVSAVEEQGMPFSVDDLYYSCVNVPFIKFLEAKYPGNKRACISPKGINVADKYELTPRGVNEVLKHYGPRMQINYRELSDYPVIAKVIRSASFVDYPHLAYLDD